MSKNPNKKKSIQRFSFYIFGEIFEQFLSEFSESFEKFSESREWSIEQPELFSKSDEDSYIIGGELKIFDAWKGKVEKEDDLKNYYDVKSIIDFLTEYSYRYSGEIEFQIGDVDVGSIENGVPSEGLSITLLEEWEKQLGLR